MTSQIDTPELRQHRPSPGHDAPLRERFVVSASGVLSGPALHTLVLLGVLIAAASYLTIASPNFLTVSNTSALLQTIAVLCIAAIGQTLAIIAGGFDLSVGGVLPLAGIAFATVANGVAGPWGVVAAAAVAIACGVLVGLLNGFFIAKLHVNPMITTLGTLSIAGGAAFLFNGGVTVIVENRDALVFARRIVGPLTWDVAIVLVLVVITSLVLHLTMWGRVTYALGGSTEAVRRAGIRADRATIGVYVASAVFAAVAGIVATSQLQAASPISYTDAALSTVTAAILGGAVLGGGSGTVLGTVLGSLLLGVVANGLNLLQINTFYQTMITGVVLLVAVGLTKAKDILTRTTE